MSNDLLLLSLEQNASSLTSLRDGPPLFAAIVCLEDVGTDPFESLQVALPEYVRATAGQVAVVHTKPFCTGVGGRTYALTVFADDAVPAAPRDAAYRAFLPLGHRMSGLIRSLPDGTRGRLGIGEVFGVPVDDWVWVLFHLAWHFPHHFARGAVRRDRLLRADHGTFPVPEEWIQLGLSGDPQDIYPGLIFSRFPRELDLVSATGHAIELLRQAVRGRGTFEVTDANRDHLRRLHREFVAAGELAAQFGGRGADDLDARVLRLDNSFRTPPAARWAGYQPGGAVQETLRLSSLRAVKEVCVLRGASVADFVRRADQAGALLPTWPASRGAALLGDVTTWLMRLNRRRELAAEQFYFVTEDGSPPAGQPVPRSQVVAQVWESTRSSFDWGGMVTDDRGNVERWLGFVFYMLKEYDPESVEIRTFPERPPNYAAGWNAMLTLRELNVYQASARAMELVGWVWRPEENRRQSEPPRTPTGQHRLAREVSFDDPWVTNNYPPPAVGRYVRFHRGDRSETGEPEWLPGWAWAERPEDGWVECGVCGPPSCPVLIARGRSPAVCDWLPAEWPAGYFPLGAAAEHCAGWRELVLSILIHGQDTIPPDDREYGWLTLTRASRQLAHHLGVISMERLLAPLPASRADARREIEPLLDGLVLARRNPSNSPQPARADTCEASRPTAAEPANRVSAMNLSPIPGDAAGAVCLRDHANQRLSVLLSTCRYNGRPACPDYLAQTPDRLGDPWLAERLLSGCPLELWATRGGTWFVLDRARAEAVAINEDQLGDLRACPAVTTTTTTASAPATVTPETSGSGAAATSGQPVIDETELSVLALLRDRHPLLLKNVDIEVAADLGKQKVGEVIAELIGKNLVARPKGERKGATITPEGIALVDRIRKSSADHP